MEDAAKAVVDAADNQRNAAKSRGDAARREVDQSKRQLQCSEQRLAEEQKNVAAFQKTIQLAKGQELAAKDMVDAACHAKEAALDKQRKGANAWCAANKKYLDQYIVLNRLRENIKGRCGSWNRFSRQCWSRRARRNRHTNCGGRNQIPSCSSLVVDVSESPGVDPVDQR